MAFFIEGVKYYWTTEVCQQANISRSTLLRWLNRGVISEPHRDRRDWRIFNETKLLRIKSEVNKVNQFTKTI